MSTWITHLRIGENLLELLNVDKENFMAGNIGPDCGVQNSDKTSFIPPKDITHFSKKISENERVYTEHEFLDKYIVNAKLNKNSGKYAFLLGYYIHLRTDRMWTTEFKAKCINNPLYKEKLKNRTQFIKDIKIDMYGEDFNYIDKYKDNIFKRVFVGIKDIEDYLDFFPVGAFTRRIKYIQNFYLTKRDYFRPTGRYINSEHMNNFVKLATDSLTLELSELNMM